MKHLKNLGSVMVATMACIVAFGAPVAAAGDFYATGGAGIALTGSQSTSHKFTITGASITCTTVTYTGTTPAATFETLELHPEYSGCTVFGFVGATINTAGCQYIFNINSPTVTLKSCSAGAIVVTASNAFGKCVMEVPNQSGINGQSFGTGGPALGHDILVSSNATNISAKITTSTGICPVSVGTHSSGVYTGTTTVRAASGELMAAPKFHGGAGAALTGQQSVSHKFTLTGSSLTCNTVMFSGSVGATGTSETQEMHPEFSGCIAFGFVTSTVNTAACEYLFNATSDSATLNECKNVQPECQSVGLYGDLSVHGRATHEWHLHGKNLGQ